MPLNRRSFLASLLALPAGLIAAAKSVKPKPSRFMWEIDWKDIKIVRPSDFDGQPNAQVWKVHEGSCSLTRATIQPLTPEDIFRMADSGRLPLAPRRITYANADYDKAIREILYQQFRK